MNGLDRRDAGLHGNRGEHSVRMVWGVATWALALGGVAGARADEIAAVSFVDVVRSTVGHQSGTGNSSHTLGWAFRTSEPLWVSSVGYYDQGGNGLSEPHQVGIFDADRRLLCWATIPAGTSATYADKWRYVDIDPPVMIPGGADFTLGGTTGPAASDAITYLVGGLQARPEIAFNEPRSRYTEAGSYVELTFPDLNYRADYDYFGPNFRFAVCPEFRRQPTGVAVCPNGRVAISVGIIGAGPPALQWRRNGVPIDAAVNPSAATSTLVIQAAGTGDEGVYDCVARNACGTATSDPATLHLCPADANCDGFLDFFDYDDFVAAFESGAAGSDFNGDGFVDFFDYDGFVETFEAGC